MRCFIMENEKLLKLYRTIETGEATAIEFEEAIAEQKFTEEIIKLIIKYYKNYYYFSS